MANTFPATYAGLCGLRFFPFIDEPQNVAAHVRLGRILLAASGHDLDPQLAKPYGELLDALDHGVKPEERS